jgi:uncharacterized protein YceH (UPF0502 family)
VTKLSAEEARVLGALIEKSATTPDSYPLSANALRLACNQTTNRDPVVDYDQRTVDAVMIELRQRGLARTVHQSGSRVAKHRHAIDEALGLTADEAAVLAVLLLRGPQTLNEVASRTARYAGGPSGVQGVDAALDRLAAGDEPLIARLDRRLGEREPRVEQLLAEVPAGGGADVAGGTATTTRAPAAQQPGWSDTDPLGMDGDDDLMHRVDTLETALAEQTARIDRLLEALGEI